MRTALKKGSYSPFTPIPKLASNAKARCTASLCAWCHEVLIAQASCYKYLCHSPQGRILMRTISRRYAFGAAVAFAFGLTACAQERQRATNSGQ